MQIDFRRNFRFLGLDRFEKSVKNARCGYLTHLVIPDIHRDTYIFGCQVHHVDAAIARCGDANVALLMRFNNFLLDFARIG